VKVILPVAGKGTRLLPLTRHVPKPLIRVAGRPVLDYVIDKLDGLDVEELIFITGHLKEQIEDYVRSRYRLPARFVEQRVQDGTAGAVNLARPFVDGPVLIVFVDTVFDADLSLAARSNADGIIWVKEVEDYQRFGVVVTDQRGDMQRIVEKPATPISRLANIGLYYIRDWRTLFEGIAHTLRGPQMKGEWFLTDAFQYMIDHGKRLATAEVAGWYDCGKVETVLATNRVILERLDGQPPPAGVTVVPPVLIEEGAVVRNATLGPNVTVEAGAVIEDSTLRDAIVGRGAVVNGSTVEHSLLGDEARVEGATLHNMVVARDEMGVAP
jgi:glucose-1-phosphate thymidylyltransferase